MTDEILLTIPSPKSIALFGEKTRIKPCICSEFDCRAVSAFSEYAERLWNITFEKGEGGIEIIAGPEMKDEEYRLDISKKAVIKAKDNYGAARALATLIQISEPDGEAITADSLSVSDYPDRDFRAVMVDLARNFHPTDTVLRYIDICFFYKIRYLHLHFTDDQSYTLPCRCFPFLPTEGKCYSEKEIAEIRDYAEARGIQIIPEIDTPGHSYQFFVKYGERFGNCDILCQHGETINALKQIYTEASALFPESDYFHIGGDEGKLDNWAQCPECIKYLESRKISPSPDRNSFLHRALADYISVIADTVKSCGKKPIVWEGFSDKANDYLSKDITVMSFENTYQLSPKLTEAGFDIVNCSWIPMYIVPMWKYRPPKEVYDWDIFRFEALSDKSPFYRNPYHMPPTDKVIGGELLAWGDFLKRDFSSAKEGLKCEMEMVSERCGALAQNTWCTGMKPDYGVFSRTDIKLLEKLRKIIL